MSNLKLIANEINEVKELKEIAEILFAISSMKYLFLRDLTAETSEVMKRIDFIYNSIFNSISTANLDLNNLLISIGSNISFCGNFNNFVKNKTNEVMKYQSFDKIYIIGQQIAINELNAENMKFPESRKLEKRVVVESKINFAKSMIEANANSIITIVYNSIDKNNLIHTKCEDIFLLNNDTMDIFEFQTKGYDTLFNNIIIDSEPKTTLTSLLNLYAEHRFLNILLDSEKAENFLRFTIMNSAKDESESLIKNLQKKYNKARQAKITNEMTEIIMSFKSIKPNN